MSSAADQSHSAPAKVTVLKLDTLGDLVLFAPTLRAIRGAWPQAKIAVLIRESYLSLAPLLAPSVEWLTTSIDPFAQGPGNVAATVAELRDLVTTRAPDIVVAATSRRNWLEAVLAAASPKNARRLALGSAESDPFFSTQLKLQHGLNAAEVFTETVDTIGYEQDWQRNFCLADALLGRVTPRVAPHLSIDAHLRDNARALLARQGLTAGKFVLCAAAGFANVPIKTWPAEKFAAALRQINSTHELPALLVGSESEHSYLESIRAAAGNGVVWTGRPGELPLLAALIAESALFFGNDTGATHLAAALDVPVVAVFGGGTWPRFIPAARRSVSIVQPLPCFGCGWECVFGDAPCVEAITVEDAIQAVDFAFAHRHRDHAEIHRVEYLPSATRDLMGKAATHYRALQADHRARQHKIEEKEQGILEKERAIAEKEAAIGEKEAEIDALKAICDERERLVVRVDGHARALSEMLAREKSDHELLKQTLDKLPADSAAAARALNDQAVHIRNLEAMHRARELELAELKASANNRASGLHDLEQAKHYSRLLAEKEAVIQALRRGNDEREHVIKQLSAEATVPTAKLRKAWIAISAHAREKWWRPFDSWLFKKVVEEYWMQIGVLRHYEPRPLHWDSRLPGPRLPDAQLPQIGLVTPSYGQEKFIERTMLSVLNQHYPKLLYVVQDGDSKDRSAEIIARQADRLKHWESAKDNGQADAIRRGFKHLEASLAPNDLMAWLNSDDLLAPGALRFVAEYFAQHPEVDVLYGHRIIVDDDDRDVGRWIMPRHDPATLEWIDYVPQETLFWRKRAWNLVGGIDPSFQFALDWDLLARFQQANCRMVRVPYFLGAFRVHAEQKTSQAIHTTGAEEMQRIRTRFHGEKQDDFATIDRHAREARFWGAITARLHEVGIRW